MTRMSRGQTGGDSRSSYLDNAKAMLIALVVLGHLFAFGMRSEPPLMALNMLVYSFHMPAFAFISGYLSSRNPFTPRGSRRLVQLISWYVVLQALHVGWGVLAQGADFSLSAALLYPEKTLWYFLSLASWQILLPVFALGRGRVAAATSIAAAVLVSLGFGLLAIDGLVLSIMRTAVFLPFFVAGHHARGLEWHLDYDMRGAAAAVSVFVVAYVVLLQRLVPVRLDWLFGAESLARLGEQGVRAVLVRLVLLVTSAVLVAGFMEIVPRRPTFFSGLGGSTMSVYSWHFFVIRVGATFGLSAYFASSLPQALATTLLLLVILGYGPIAAITLRVLSPVGAPCR